MFLNCEFNFCLQRDHPDSPELTVHHCQYTAWLDHQVPKYPASLVRFVQTVRRAYRDEETPMVVHCRYMRTGTQCHVGGKGIFAMCMAPCTVTWRCIMLITHCVVVYSWKPLCMIQVPEVLPQQPLPTTSCSASLVTLVTYLTNLIIIIT